MLWEPLWCILVNFGAFWCIPCATAWPLNDFLWLLYPSKCPFMDDISDSGQIWNTLLCHAMDTILVLFGAFWCILVHIMCNPMTPPWLALTPPPFQVSITPFTPDMDHLSHSGQIQNTYLCHGTVTILVYFGPFWCASWATPQPLCIEFSSSHQKHVFYASRAFKRYQPLLPCSGNTVLTWALFMG